MAQDQAYRDAQAKIAVALRTGATSLDLRSNQLTQLPTEIGQLQNLTELDLSANQLTELPPEIGQLQNLTELDLSENDLIELPAEIGQLQNLIGLYIALNQLTELPPEIGQLQNLAVLYLSENDLTELPMEIGQLQNLAMFYLRMNSLIELPAEIGQLQNLTTLYLSENRLTELPAEIGQLQHLTTFDLDNNFLNPELEAAYQEGLESLFTYLRAQTQTQITLNEAKLILVGEGEVGKSCLLSALRGDPWIENRPTTHGVEIHSFPVIAHHPDGSNTEITLNGWDFGGQQVYRPTHQLFFSAPAIYLVVWKPREGPQQGFVKEWITLITRREPSAKILIVATHNGPNQRRPDIDRQELLDEFGSDTILGFYHVDSKPDDITHASTGIAELKTAIATISATLPEMGQTVPATWNSARKILQNHSQPYLPYPEVLRICADQGIPDDQTELFLRISHRLGHLVYYHKDQTNLLNQYIILKPDWLAKAISFVFDDAKTRHRNGLADFAHLSQIWSAPPFPDETGYPKEIHPIFLYWMERFDISYKVKLDLPPDQDKQTSLIAQLVPDYRPQKLTQAWPDQLENSDRQQTQICRIVDDRGQFAPAEGLFYQLIVRLHKYSLGRENYNDSIHWQRGLILDNDYNGRAYLEQKGTDIHITVRAAYPDRFLAQLTGEIEWLIKNFWKGLECRVMLPCINPCGKNDPGCGLFDVQKLIESKKKNRPEYPCELCNEWQNIDQLLSNAPIVQNAVIASTEIQQDLQQIKQQLNQGFSGLGDRLDSHQRMLLSQIDRQFDTFMRMTIDEAKEGPRLFSFKSLDPKFLDKPKWLSTKFQITLWCEHSRIPLPLLNLDNPKKGVYEIDIPREWFVKSAPWLKVMTTTLGLVLPVASSAIKFELDDATYKGFEEQLDFGQKTLEMATKSTDLALNQPKSENPSWQSGDAILAEGSMLRQLQHLIKQKDPSFGGLERVQNNRREFLWIHRQFLDQY